MGEARRRGSYADRKANPRGKVETPKLHWTLIESDRGGMSRDGKRRYVSTGHGLRRVKA